MSPPVTAEAPNVNDDDVPEVNWAELALAVRRLKANNSDLGSYVNLAKARPGGERVCSKALESFYGKPGKQ